MKPSTVVLAIAALAIAIGAFFLSWYVVTQGAGTITIAPGRASQCTGGACQSVNPDDLGYDSTWLGLTSASRIAAGLGVFAAAAGAALSKAGKTQFGSGGSAIKRGHLLFAALVGLGIVGGSLATKPSGIAIAPGALVTLVGFALVVSGLLQLGRTRPKAGYSDSPAA